jgi:hypothetical protein
MDKKDKELMFRRIREVIDNYNMLIYLDRHGAIYKENLQLRIKEELTEAIRKELLD